MVIRITQELKSIYRRGGPEKSRLLRLHRLFRQQPQFHIRHQKTGLWLHTGGEKWLPSSSPHPRWRGPSSLALKMIEVLGDPDAQPVPVVDPEPKQGLPNV